MRSPVSVVALGLATVVVLVAALVAFGITSEYGSAPNGGGLREAASGVLGALPAAALVAVLLAVAARRAPQRRRLLVALAGLLTTLLAVALGMLLGHLALQQRCDDLGSQHSAACTVVAGYGVTGIATVLRVRAATPTVGTLTTTTEVPPWDSSAKR